ncbi:hypothetical protein BKA93DRAFT_775313 [Sparassis latifolia]
MQPSEYEIQQEVEALRDIRRRSTAGGPGSLILDPDLPNASSPTSPVGYWTPTDDSSSSSNEDSSESSHVNAQDDPFHLFWVPARLHPEIAPAEFRAFLKEHARAPVDEVGVLGRSSTISSSNSLSRKKSMLSRQYKPSANDGVEDEKVIPIRRNRTSVYANSGPQLTINDLQKLEELAEEASQSDDSSRLRSVLRRSLSLNVAPSVIDQMDDMPDMGDDADSPIIVPRPGQILRRAARTKIRKPGQTGEGAHRFTTTRSRRKSVTRSGTLPPEESRTSSDMSSSDHGEGDLSLPELSWKTEIPEVPEVPPLPRPESYSEESSIYDAYATDDSEDVEPFTLVTTPEPAPTFVLPPPVVIPSPSHVLEPVPEAISESTLSPILHHPQPQRVVPPVSAPTVPQRSPSPEPPSSARTNESVTQPRESTSSSRPSYVPSPSASEQRREKDKKGLFGKWGGDKGGKKHHKDKEIRDRDKEKESGFFGSLFGAKKKQEESPPSLGISTNGRETAAALLGASKSSKNYVPPPSPQLANAYARYPIHVERAIYRLSHIKLANPRRPLYEQVLISNLMFWYLGIINKQQQQNQPQPNGTPAQTAGTAAEDEQSERDQKEREERERGEKERLEKEQAEQKKESRRGSLTKSPGCGSPVPGARRAEIPVRGPQYEMQHRVMEQEYGYGAPGNVPGITPSMARPLSAPVGANGSMLGYPAASSSRTSSSAPSPYSVQLVQPQPQTPNNRYYDMSQSRQYPTMVTGTPQLPPGAMSPAAVEQTWLSSTGSAPSVARNHTSSSPPPRATSPPSLSAQSSPRRTRSPPAGNRYTPAQEKQPYSGQRVPGRSLSASAVPPVPPMPQINGKVKKGASAHAVVQHRHGSEDEDVPLAVWQQQQRRK